VSITINVGDLIARCRELTGLDFVGKKKDVFYYLFQVDYTGPTPVYYLIKRFDTIQEMKLYLMDMIITEEVLQE